VIAFSLVEKLVEWVQPAFVTQFAGISVGYFIVLAAVMAERSIFIGLIVPGDVILALGGVYASQGRMSLAAVIVIGTLAAIVGESIGYWLGRKYGKRLIRRIPLVNRLQDQLENSQEYFKRHGGKTVAIGRYATAAGAFIPFTAGAGRMPYRRFLLFDIPAIIVWATVISIIGYVFGNNLDRVDKILSRFGYGVLALIVLFFAGRYLMKRRRERRERRASERATR
jgi:membrane-associated protein